MGRLLWLALGMVAWGLVASLVFPGDADKLFVAMFGLGFVYCLPDTIDKARDE